MVNVDVPIVTLSLKNVGGDCDIDKATNNNRTIIAAGGYFHNFVGFAILSRLFSAMRTSHGRFSFLSMNRRLISKLILMTNCREKTKVVS
jgi:hypothetical protein